MSISLPQVTVVGTLTNDPDLKFVGNNGSAVANFTVASNSRKFNKDTSQYEDGDATFLRCTAWKQLAENIAESLSKGTRVVVTGQLKQNNFTDKEGNKRSSLDLEVDEVGPSLKWAIASVSKAGAKVPAAAKSEDPWGGSPDW